MTPTPRWGPRDAGTGRGFRGRPDAGTGRGFRGRPDAGSIAPAVPILALVILLLGGLVIDASRLLIARGRAVAYAEEAARAGAGAVDLTVPELRLLPDQEVQDRVSAYCAEAARAAQLTETQLSCSFVGTEPSAEDPDRALYVRTQTRITVPATLLGLVGVRELRASGWGRARPVEGIQAPDDVAPLEQVPAEPAPLDPAPGQPADGGQPGADQPGADQLGADQPGADQLGADQPPSADEPPPATDQPGAGG